MLEQDRDNDLQNQLISIFIVESQDYIQSMTHKLLVLEKDPAGTSKESILVELLRETHSLKGAARAVNNPKIETLAHRLENVLVDLRDGNLTPSGGIFDLVFKTIDTIGAIIQNIKENKEEPVDIIALKNELDKLISNKITPVASHKTSWEEKSKRKPKRIPNRKKDTKLRKQHYLLLKRKFRITSLTQTLQQPNHLL